MGVKIVTVLSYGTGHPFHVLDLTCAGSTMRKAAIKIMTNVRTAPILKEN